jgi:DNA modification methylase
MIEPYYQDDLVTIYHGDCAEIVPQLGRFDLLLTDPPYGIGFDEAASANNGKQGWVDYGKTEWDRARPSKNVFDTILHSADNAVIWGGNYFADLLPPSMGWIAWDKGQRNFTLADFEMAWTSKNGAARCFQ